MNKNKVLKKDTRGNAAEEDRRGPTRIKATALRRTIYMSNVRRWRVTLFGLCTFLFEPHRLFLPQLLRDPELWRTGCRSRRCQRGTSCDGRAGDRRQVDRIEKESARRSPHAATRRIHRCYPAFLPYTPYHEAHRRREAPGRARHSRRFRQTQPEERRPRGERLDRNLGARAPGGARPARRLRRAVQEVAAGDPAHPAGEVQGEGQPQDPRAVRGGEGTASGPRCYGGRKRLRRGERGGAHLRLPLRAQRVQKAGLSALDLLSPPRRSGKASNLYVMDHP